jgi:hypothetical protein
MGEATEYLKKFGTMSPTSNHNCKECGESFGAHKGSVCPIAPKPASIAVGDLVKFIGKGDGQGTLGGPPIGATGKVTHTGGKAAYGSIRVELDAPWNKHYSEWWTIPSKLEVLGLVSLEDEYQAKFGKPNPDTGDVCHECGKDWAYHSGSTCPTIAEATDSPDSPVADTPAAASPAWDLESLTVSLSGSGAKYARGHIRLESKGIRLQGNSPINGNKWEDSYSSISDGLRGYIKSLTLDCPSVANTGTMYARCLIRRDGSNPYAVRVQIPGNKFNREWGAEFVISHMANASKLPGSQPGDAAKLATSPTILTEPAGMPVHEPAGQELAVGDKVVMVKEGDADGCTHGPKLGVMGVVSDIMKVEEAMICGTVKVKVEGCGGLYWTATANHWAKLASPVLPKEPTSPSAYAPNKNILGVAIPGTSCVNCGKAKSAHYPGDAASAYDPPLCPDMQAHCPTHGMVGPVPLAIHAIVCMAIPKVPSTGVPF